jgi:hypothetical protein
MAEKIVWESVSRSGKLLQEAVWVGVRRTGIKISCGLWKKLRLAERKINFVLVKKSERHQAILLKFLTPEDLSNLRLQDPVLDGVYTLNADGGGKERGKKSAGGVVQVQSLIKHTPWLRAAAEEPLTERRRFIPEQAEHELEWVMRLTPGFTYRTDAQCCDVPASIKGIYRYVGRNEKTLYIGQGQIKSRFNRHAWEKNLPAKRFEWTPIQDERARKNAEDHHLNEHVRQYGELPEYNRTPARRKKRI